jgi:hypothetical protein
MKAKIERELKEKKRKKKRKEKKRNSNMRFGPNLLWPTQSTSHPLWACLVRLFSE